MMYNKQHRYEMRRETEDGHNFRASIEGHILSLCNSYTLRLKIVFVTMFVEKWHGILLGHNLVFRSLRLRIKTQKWE